MFEFIKHNKWVTRIVAVIIVVPFLFFGVEWYFMSASNQDVARVGNIRISADTFARVLANKRDQARSQGREDPYATQQGRAFLLASLIENELLLDKAKSERFQASDNLLRHYLQKVPAFQENGRFSPDLYRAKAAQEGYTLAGLDALLKDGLLQYPVTVPVRDAELAARQSAATLYTLVKERREIKMAILMASDFVKDVTVSDEEIAAFYQENIGQFMLPEAVSIEYVMLTRDTILKDIKVTPEEARQRYEENQARYGAPEARQIAHILIATPKGATPEQKAKAKEKAEDVLKKAVATPKNFAAFAKEFSEDPGSSKQGGDIGVLKLGTLVKPFEDAVASAKESGVINALVETNYGFHIIKVAITPARVVPFEEVHAKVTEEIRQERASQLFAQSAESFKNKVQGDATSYADTAKELGADISTASFLTRPQLAILVKGDQRFVEEVFKPETIESKMNTEAMDIGSDAVISARVLEYKAPEAKPLADVSAAIREALQQRAAMAKAESEGKAQLARLNEGKTADARFGHTLSMDRQSMRSDIPEDVKRDLFLAPISKKPAYFGGADKDRFVIVKLEKVVENVALPEAEVKTAENMLREIKGEELYRAYITLLNEDAKIKIFDERFKSIQ